MSSPGSGPPPGPAPAAIVIAAAQTSGVVALVLTVYAVLPLDRPFRFDTAVALAAGLVAVGLLIGQQVLVIRASRDPGLRAGRAVAIALCVFLVLFAATDVLIDAGDPHAFTERLSRIDGIYYVMSLFATVGFGDIAPVSELARVVAVVQMLGDLLFIGLGVRALGQAVERSRARARSADRSGPGAD